MSNDLVNPALLEEAERLRSGLWESYRTIERREWLYRYCCLVTGIEVPKPMFGSSTSAELGKEIDLLNLARENCFTEAETTDFLMKRLENKYGHSWGASVALGTDSRLVEGHHHVWDAGTESLIPQQIGRSILVDRYDYSGETQSRNMGYSYRNPEGPELVDLYLYAASMPNLPSGLSEELVSEAGAALQEIFDYSNSKGDEILEIAEWQAVEFISFDEESWPVLTVAWTAKTAGNNEVFSALTMTGFRGGIAKVRWSVPAADISAEDWKTRMAIVEAHLANFFYTFR